MRCAGKPAPVPLVPGPAAAVRLAARPLMPVLLAVVLLGSGLLAGCSGGPGRAGAAPSPSRSGERIAGGPRGRAQRVASLAGGHGGPGGAIVFAPAGGGPGGGGEPVIVFASGTSGGSGGRPPVAVGPIPPVTATRPVVMPLDSYGLISSQEQSTLAAAAIALTQRCMAARGFVFTQASAADNGLATLQQIETAALGLTSLTRAQAYGYATPGSGSGQAGPGLAVLAQGSAGGFVPAGFGGPGGPAGGTHSPAWTAALDGTAARPGCLRQAQSVLYGSAGDGDPVSTLAFQAAGWAQNDPRVKVVIGAWSACMAGRGFRYTEPDAPALHRWPKAPTRTEIATAVADVTCKQRVNLVNTLLTVEAAYQQALVGQNLAELSRLQSDAAVVLQRARALLASQAG
jgi:hypothetical protein